MIPKFSGKIEELRVYLNKIDDLYSYIFDGDEAIFVTVVKTNLTGEAATEILDEDNVDTWDELKKLLLKAFKPHENHVNEIAMLQSLKQSQNDTVETFCNKIKKNLLKLKSVVPIGATRQFWFQHTERYAIQCLEDGLRDVKVQARLVSERKTTFQAAAQFAMDTENRLNKNISDIPKEKSIKESDNKSISFCNYCKKKGHKIENCELRNKKNNNNVSNVDKKSFKCEICEKDTHSTSICYKNPKNIKPDDKKTDVVTDSLHSISVEQAVTGQDSNDIWFSSEN